MITQMKPSILLGVFLILVLAGCGNNEAPVQETVARPVKTIVVENPSAGGVRKFPASVDATKKVDLAFRVSGTVNQLNVLEGDKVQKDQVLAQLDQTDFEIVVRDRQATYDRTRKDFERAKKLIEDGHISRRDYDSIESEFKNADAALATSRQDLAYTTLKAPFDGNIAERMIQNHEEIVAKQPVLALRDLSILDVIFDVPESVVRSLAVDGINALKSQDQQKKLSDRIPVYAQFGSNNTKKYPLRFKEAAAKADTQTQTFRVTYQLDAPTSATILPGMSAEVTVDMTAVTSASNVFLIPNSSLTADSKLATVVWVVNPETMTVSERKVTTANMVGSDTQITSGLQPGDIVVTAGAAYLSDGMKVRLQKRTEQAEARTETL